MIIRWMKSEGLPITRRRYLALAYGKTPARVESRVGTDAPRRVAGLPAMPMAIGVPKHSDDRVLPPPSGGFMCDTSGALSAQSHELVTI